MMSREQSWETFETHCVAIGAFMWLKTPKSSSSAGYIEGKRATELIHQKSVDTRSGDNGCVSLPFLSFNLLLP